MAAGIRVYDETGNVIETHEHIRGVLKLALGSTHFDVPATQKRVLNESR
jgi:hypothetical protein